ncbi:MAG TPA: hypothetical protein VFF06_12395 [Polyangia bacterium]|nr:hypothetical protein [Polyangia bacterium]
MHRRQLPIASSCRERWDAMTPDGRGRRCAHCSTTVVDLSSLTEREARRLIASGAVTCARYRFDDDGEVRFRPEPPRRGLERLAVGLGVASLLVGATPARADVSTADRGPEHAGEHVANGALAAVSPAAATARTTPANPHARQAAHAPRKKPERSDSDAMGLLVSPQF